MCPRWIRRNRSSWTETSKRPIGCNRTLEMLPKVWMARGCPEHTQSLTKERCGSIWTPFDSCGGNVRPGPRLRRRTRARTQNQFSGCTQFFNRASGAQIPFGFNDTGLAVNTDRSPEPRTKTGIEADDDPFSVEVILEELFAKTKRR
jgi:hypothetical protein